MTEKEKSEDSWVCPFHSGMSQKVEESVSWKVFSLFCGIFIFINGLGLWRNETNVNTMREGLHNRMSSLSEHMETLEKKHIQHELEVRGLQKDLDFAEKNQVDIRARLLSVERQNRPYDPNDKPIYNPLIKSK